MLQSFIMTKRSRYQKIYSFTFDEIAELKVNTIGKAVFDAIIKKKAKYQIDGTYHLDTQFGNFKLKAKLVEREI